VKKKKKKKKNRVKNGIIEPDASSALSWTVDYFNKGSNLKDCYFVLIGAGSAMGPCAKLLELGANVVAIDIPGKVRHTHMNIKKKKKNQVFASLSLSLLCM
jgi:hypothetical protein